MHSAARPAGAGEVFLDARGDHRALQVSCHAEVGVVVLSLWRAGACSGTFRLAVGEVPALIDVLRGGLSTAYGEARRPTVPGVAGENPVAG